MERRRAKERDAQPYQEEDDSQGRLQDTRNPRRVRYEEHTERRSEWNSMATTAQQAALKRVKDAPRRRGSQSPAKLTKFGANPVQHHEQQPAFGFGQVQSSGPINQNNAGIFSNPTSSQDSTANSGFDQMNPAPGSISLTRLGPEILGNGGATWKNAWANKDPEPNPTPITPNPTPFATNPFVAPTFNVNVPVQVPNNPFSNPTNQPTTGYQGSMFNIPAVFNQPVPSSNNFFSQNANPNQPFAFSNTSIPSQQPAQVEAPAQSQAQAPTSLFSFNATSNSVTTAPTAPVATSSIFSFNSTSAATQPTAAPTTTPNTSIFTFNPTAQQPAAVSAAPTSTSLFSFNTTPKQIEADQPATVSATPTSTSLFSFSTASKRPEASQPTAVSATPVSKSLFSFNTAPKQPETDQPATVSAASPSANLFSFNNAPRQSVTEQPASVSTFSPSTGLFSFNSTPKQQITESEAPKPNLFTSVPLTSGANLFNFNPAPKLVTESATATKLAEKVSVTPSANPFSSGITAKQSGLEPVATPKLFEAAPLAPSASLFGFNGASKQPMIKPEAKPFTELSDNDTTTQSVVAPAGATAPTTFDFNTPLPSTSTQSASFNPFKLGAAPPLKANGPDVPPPQNRYAGDRQTAVKPATPSAVGSALKTLGANLFSPANITPSSTPLNRNLTPSSRSKTDTSSSFHVHEQSFNEDGSLAVGLFNAMDPDQNTLSSQNPPTPVPETQLNRKIKKLGKHWRKEEDLSVIESELKKAENDYIVLCRSLNNATRAKFINMPFDSRLNVSAWAKYYIGQRRKLDEAYELQKCTILSKILRKDNSGDTPMQNAELSGSNGGDVSSKMNQMGPATSGSSRDAENSGTGSSRTKRKADEPADNDRTADFNTGKRTRTIERQQDDAEGKPEGAKKSTSQTAGIFSSILSRINKNAGTDKLANQLDAVHADTQDQETQRTLNVNPFLSVPQASYQLPASHQPQVSYKPRASLEGRIWNDATSFSDDDESNARDAERKQLDEAEIARVNEARRHAILQNERELEARLARTREETQTKGVYIPAMHIIGTGYPRWIRSSRDVKLPKDISVANSIDVASDTGSTASTTATTKLVIPDTVTSGATTVVDSRQAQAASTTASDADESPEQTAGIPKRLVGLLPLESVRKGNEKRKAGVFEGEEDSMETIRQDAAQQRVKKQRLLQQDEGNIASSKSSSALNPFHKAVAGATITSSFAPEGSSPGLSTSGGASVFDSPKEPATSIPARNIFGHLSKSNSESGVGDADDDNDNDGSYDSHDSSNDRTDDSRNGRESSGSSGHGQRRRRSRSPNGRNSQDNENHSPGYGQYRERDLFLVDTQGSSRRSHDEEDEEEDEDDYRSQGAYDRTESSLSADDKGSQSEGSTYFSRRLGNRLDEAERRRESPDVGYRRSERGRSPSARSVPDEDTRSTASKVEEPVLTGGLFDRISKGSDGKPLRAPPTDEKSSNGSSVFGQSVIPATTENPFPDPFRTSALGSGTSSGPVFNPFKPRSNFPAEGSPAGDQTWKESTPIKFSSGPSKLFAANDGDQRKDARPLGEAPEDAPTPSVSELPKFTFSNPTGGLFGSTPNSPAPNANVTKSADVGFTFGGPPKNMASFLMPSAATSITTSRASTPGATTDTGGESATESVAEGEEDSEQLNLTTVGPGEENEEVLFEIRAKAFKIDGETKVFKSHGVGPLRVLKHRGTGKARVLLRSDPNGNVALNAALLKGIKYEVKEPGNYVSVITVSDDNKPMTWQIKVGKKEDAAELARILEEAKPQ